MAAIRKRNTGNWEVQVRRRGYAVQTATFDTRKQAEDWAKTVEGDMARGRFVSLAEAERTSLGEALARYGREVTPRKAQVYRELQTIARLIFKCGSGGILMTVAPLPSGATLGILENSEGKQE